MESLKDLIKQWISAQPSMAESVDTLVWDNRTLRVLNHGNASGAQLFIVQVGLDANTRGVAIAQSTYSTEAGNEIFALREVLAGVKLRDC